MTINIQKATNVNVTGHHSNKNCKAIYNITTGEIYASGIDAANVLGVDPASVSGALTGKSKTCKGMRLCLVSKMMEHLEEITEQNRIRVAKVEAYDKMIAERNAKRDAQEKLAKHRAECEKLRAKLEKEMQLMQEAEALCAG
jgi:predicted transcriptional regulator with HTH domain